MRISELAATTGLTVATIKFYLREGLLPAGRSLGPTSADYDEHHVRRLRLIRALREVGELPLASIQELIRVLDDPSQPIHEVLGTVQLAVSRLPKDPPFADRETAGQVVRDLGWHVRPDGPLLGAFASTVGVLNEFGFDINADRVKPWADAAMHVARVELADLPEGLSRDELAEFTAVGITLFGRMLSQLRLLAQESLSAERFAGAPVLPEVPLAGGGATAAAECG
ncbi:MAG TPA: MerR family transcriptional regulator [Cellulomonas sp.]